MASLAFQLWDWSFGGSRMRRWTFLYNFNFIGSFGCCCRLPLLLLLIYFFSRNFAFSFVSIWTFCCWLKMIRNFVHRILNKYFRFMKTEEISPSIVPDDSDLQNFWIIIIHWIKTKTWFCILHILYTNTMIVTNSIGPIESNHFVRMY